jgi:flagellar biogenesis protein FliO
MRAAVLALAFVPVLVSASASAEPVSFEVADRGKSVEVIAHNLQAKTTTISSVRSRLEVPVTGSPVASRQMMTDGTVFLVELDGTANRVLSVKTRLDHPEVKALAGLATATQIGTDLHLTFPRHAIVGTAKPAEAKPAPVAEAKPAPIVEPKPIAAPAPAPVVVEAKPAPVVEPKLTKPVPAVETKPATPVHPIPAEKDSALSSPGVYALGALFALLACGYVLKKKKKDAAAVTTIDVVAQRSLGNKAKVMWLSAGGRDMIVSVTSTNVRMLGQWSRGEDKQLPRATSLEGPRTSQRSLDEFRDEFKQELAEANAVPQLATTGANSSVSGILKLRARTVTGPIPSRVSTIQPLPQVNADVATEDEEADMEWAREILTATGGRR